MEQQTCPQCKMVCDRGEIRCPRCHKLLVTTCNGNCSKCKQKDKCS